MKREERSIVDIVKDNVRDEWEGQGPKDWRDAVHMLTDGWLEPFERMKGGAPAWLLIGGAVLLFLLFIL